MASTSSLSKRARAPVAGTSQYVTCMVDGCKSDLSKCRDYHRRHKVCELHSKTPKVSIAGQDQRFCQQCSRFHSLVEFDEGKRSCRKRLDGHNRRRRKPRPESLSLTSSRFLSHYQGGRYLTFGGGEGYGGLMNDSVYYSSDHHDRPAPQPGFIGKQDGFAVTSSSSPHPVGEGGKHLMFLQVTEQNFPEPSRPNGATCPPELCFDGHLGSMTGGGGALSLLSSPQPLPPMPPQPEDRYSALNSIFHNGPFQPAHSHLPAELHHFHTGLALPAHSTLSGRSPPEIFHIESEGSSATEPHHGLSFSWG